MTYLLKIIFFIGDLLFLNLAILLSFYLSKDVFWDASDLNQLYLVLYSNIGWFFLVLVSNPYSLNKGWSMSKIFRSQSAFIFIHSLIVLSLVIFFKKNYTITQIVFIYLIFFPVFFSWKVFVIYIRKLFIPEIKSRNYIVIGRNNLSEDIRKHYLINRELGFRFKGYFDGISNYSLLERLKAFCRSNEVHEIYYCVTDANEEQLKKLVSFGLDSLIKVKLISTSPSQNQSIQLGKYDQIPGLGMATLPLDEFINQFIKRAFDLVFSVIFLLSIFSWLYAIIALLIKLDSKGPVFFIQMRNGLNNKPFGCFKFRTMSFERNAEFIQATKNDQRITRIGKFLRKSSIDELPQFINVFRGDMSLIGPRPHPIKLNEDFSGKIKSMVSRHYVKPGITGLAQCMGYRGETQTLTDMENRVRLDRYYIENWSFWLDIKIIFLTVVSLIRGSDNAY
ncbi:MAG: exopolysaccharide biosynthesis polyprenyl glycosylphosphotransferase [Cyclobacteriaceae bacterium]